MADKPLSKEELANRIEKLRPFLVQGQSLKKACVNAKVPITATYDYYNSDVDFANQIDEIVNNVSRVYYQGNYQRILLIGNKIARITKLHNDLLNNTLSEDDYHKRMEVWKLSPEEERFWNWLSDHHPNLKEEFSARSEVTGKDGSELIPKELAQPKVIETALRALEFLVKKDKKEEPQV